MSSARTAAQKLPAHIGEATEWITSSWIAQQGNTLARDGLLYWLPHQDRDVNRLFIHRLANPGFQMPPGSDPVEAVSHLPVKPDIRFLEKLPTSWITAALPFVMEASPQLTQGSFRLLLFRNSLPLGGAPDDILAWLAAQADSMFPDCEWTLGAPHRVTRALAPRLKSWTPEFSTKYFKFHNKTLPFMPVSRPFEVYYHRASTNFQGFFVSHPVVPENSATLEAACGWSLMTEAQRKRILLRVLHKVARFSDSRFNLWREFKEIGAHLGRVNLTDFARILFGRGVKIESFHMGMAQAAVTELSNRRWNHDVVNQALQRWLKSNTDPDPDPDSGPVVLLETLRAHGLKLSPDTMAEVQKYFPTFHDFAQWQSAASQ